MPRYTIQAPDGRKVTVEGASPPTEADLDGIFADLPPAQPAAEEPGMLESLGRGAAQGITFGFGDEITGAVEGAYDALTTGEDFSSAYERSRDESRAANEAAQEANPWTYGLAEVGSGVLTGGLGAARAVGAKGASSLAARLGRGAAAGGTVGGVAGTGYSEGSTPGEVLEDASTGVLAGGAIGAASPAVGRVLQRAMNRYGGRGTAQRDVQKMFAGSEDEAQSMLNANPNMMVADLGSRSREALGNVVDEDVLAGLNARAGQTRERVLGRASEIAGRQRMGMRDQGAREIETSYAKLRKPRTTMNRILDEYADDPDVVRARRAAEREAKRDYGVNSKKYPMAVLHNTSKLLRDNRNPNIQRTVGKEITDQIESANEAYRAGRSTYAKGSEVKRAYDALDKQLSSKSAAKFIRDLDPNNPNMQGTIDKIRPLFDSDDQFNRFVNSLADERAMFETLSDVQKQVVVDAGPALVKKGKGVMDAVKAFGIANAADRALGVDQKLATATAARQLLYRVLDLTPGVGGAARALTAGQRNEYQKEMAKILTSRQLPQYQAATARALTPREAGAAGAGALLSQQE